MQPFARRHFDGFEIASLNCAGQAFAPHFHDEFVLSVNVSGAEKITLDRKGLVAAEREITLYNPAQVQSSHPISEEWHILSLYVDPAFLYEAFDLTRETVFEVPVLAHDGAADRMVNAIRYGLSMDTPADEALERIILTLNELLGLAGSRQASIPRHVPPEILEVADWLRDCTEPPSLVELSHTTGLTPVQLVRTFTRAFGLPPLAWLANNRINRARERLSSGEAIAQIAVDLGFADQSHLTRRFRSIYGVPPGRWRRG